MEFKNPCTEQAWLIEAHLTLLPTVGSAVPKAECTFDKGMCGWTSDPTNPWLLTTTNRTPRFLSLNSLPILCLSTEVTSGGDTADSWFTVDIVKSAASKVNQHRVQTRLNVPASLSLRCLCFSYFLHWGKPPGDEKSHIGLSLLLEKTGDYCLLSKYGKVQRWNWFAGRFVHLLFLTISIIYRRTKLFHISCHRWLLSEIVRKFIKFFYLQWATDVLAFLVKRLLLPQ